MDNFQLYRTNVLLGGQMKWDLVLDAIGSDLIVKDFHLSPICNSIPYNKYVNEPLINYSHQENVKKIYNKISGSFYENCTDSMLESPWPIISETSLDTHVGDFEMGCRRALYKIYGKQFEFFCPLWLEHLEEPLKFELIVCSGRDKEILKKYLVFTPQKDMTKEQKYHNKFIKYFENYIKYIGLDKGNDDLLTIHLDKPLAYVSGLNVKDGLLRKKDISYINDVLISRERPVLEFDNYIISQLKDNNIVAPQLFNFNLCFNVDDILPQIFTDMMMGKPLSFKVHVYIGDKKMEIKDFYSNYEYIPRKIVGPVNLVQDENSPNVLDYMQDYRCVDLIDKNKLVQSCIHWSLVGNNDYIFNMYDGFKGYSYDEKNNIINHSHLYDDSPDINHSQYKQYLNSTGWCNLIRLSSSKKNGQLTESLFWNNIDEYVKFASDFSNNIEWVNKIKYRASAQENNIKVLLIENELDNLLDITKFNPNTSIYCMNILASYNDRTYKASYKDVTQNLSININNTQKDIDANIQVILYNYDTLIFVTKISNDKSKELLTFINLYNILYKVFYQIDLYGEKHIFFKPFKSLLDKMHGADYSNNPPIITPRTSLSIVKTTGPSMSVSEIQYIKNNREKGEYVLRYSGKIKPTFVDGNNDINFNYLYYKEFISNKEFKNSKYALYRNSKFLPIYPSLDFFPIKKIKQHYDIIPYTYKNTKMLHSYEYHWFNNNCNYILKDCVEMELPSRIENGEYVKLEILIKEYLKKLYENDSDDYINYIYSLYDVKSSFEYANPSNIIDYIYTIKLTLK